MTSTFRKRSRVIYRQESFTTGTYYTGIMVYHRIMISAGSPPRISSNTLTPIHLHLVEAGVRSFQMVPKQLHVITTIVTKLTASNMKIKRIAKKKVAEVANIKHLTGSIRKLIYWAHFPSNFHTFPIYRNLLSLSALLNCRAISFSASCRICNDLQDRIGGIRTLRWHQCAATGTALKRCCYADDGFDLCEVLVC